MMPVTAGSKIRLYVQKLEKHVEYKWKLSDSKKETVSWATEWCISVGQKLANTALNL